MDKEKFIVGEPAVSNTSVIGWLSRRYSDGVSIQHGMYETKFDWDCVELLDDLDCNWNGKTMIVKYEKRG